MDRVKINLGMPMRDALPRLGHAGTSVHPTRSGARWFASCDCGYVSTTRRTERDAIEALVLHLRAAMQAWTRTGLRVPPPRPWPVRPEAEMRRRYPQYERLCRDLEKKGVPTPGQDSARRAEMTPSLS